MGTWAATALVVSEVVGVGILLTPATMMRSLGGVWAPLAMWFATGAMTAAGALCYGELATRFPRAGGTYVFLREGFGRRCAFVYGWMAMLVMDPGITAALGIGAAQYLLATVGLSTRYTTMVALAAIVVCALLVTRGLAVGARVMAWTGGVKLAIVGVLVSAGLWRFIGGAPVLSPASGTSAGPEALAASVIAAFFAFGGWWDLGRMSEEVESPRRTMPTALIGGVLLVAAIYIVVTATFVMAAPRADAQTNEAYVAAAGAALFGTAAGRLLPGMVVVAVVGSLVAVLFGAPRTYAAMARDHVLPERLNWFDEERGRSPLGTAVQASLACLLVLAGSFNQILGYFVPAAVFFLGLSAAALAKLERPAPSSVVFSTPLYPLPLIVFLVLVTVMLVLFIVGQPTQTSLGAAVVLLGLLVSRSVI